MITTDTIHNPRFRKGWTTPKGDVKKGFWYLSHRGKKVNLTPYGATRTNGNNADKRTANDARSRYIDALRQQSTRDTLLTLTRVVTVRQVVERYKADRWPECKPGSAWPEVSGWFFKLFCDGHDGTRYNNSKPIQPYAGWGELPISKITDDTIKEWFSHHDWDPAGARNAVVAVRAALNHAVAKKMIDVNPIKDLKTKRTKSEIIIFNEESEKAYREEAQKNPAFFSFWEGNRDMGTRPAELACCKPRHIKKTPDGNLYIRLEWFEWKCGAKGSERKPGIVSLPQKWQEWVAERLTECGPDDYIWQTETGKGWKKCNWVQTNIAIRKAAGVDGVTLYSCRHTRITERVKNNESPRLIAILHRTSVKVIESTYCHAEDDLDFLASIV